jgi:hypothetical protein
VKKVLFLLAIMNISTWAVAATPFVQILSPVAVNSNPPDTVNWEGSSPMHLVAYATTSDCGSGISGMQVYTGDNQLFYSSSSSYLDIYVPYVAGSTISVKGWDNCGGTNEAVIFPYNNEQTGHVTVISPIPNVAYLQYGIPFVANATTTCPQGVSAMGVYIANHQRVATVQGASMNIELNIAPGTYNAVVEEWDNCGGAAETPLNLIVTDNGLPSPPMYAYMADPAAGTSDAFWMTTGCQMSAVVGSPNPADWNPISVSTDFSGFVYVLNQVSMNLSIYQSDSIPLLGGQTQVPGAPFSLSEPSGYTPTSVLVIDTLYVGGTTTQIYVASTSSSGAGIISTFSFDHSTQKLTSLGSPLTLKGNAQPTELVLGPPPSTTQPPSNYWVLANDGSSGGSKISVLNASVGGTPTLTESSGSPFTVTGLDGKSIQVQDIATADYNGTNANGQPLAGNLLYTANSDNSISGFVIASSGELTAVAGSPWADPDSPGTSGNPTSLAFDVYQAEIFGLDSGSSSLSVWKLNSETGVLTYSSAQQAGLIKSVVGDKIRDILNEPVDCLVTSNGYGVSVNQSTGNTSSPGLPVLNPEGHYPSISLAFW